MDHGRAIEELRSELTALREELAGEIRTRRVVVVDAQGAERITAEVDAELFERAATICVKSPDGSADVTIYAGVEASQYAGWMFSVNGNSVAMAGCGEQYGDRLAYLTVDGDNAHERAEDYRRLLGAIDGLIRERAPEARAS